MELLIVIIIIVCIANSNKKKKAAQEAAVRNKVMRTAAPQVTAEKFVAAVAERKATAPQPAPAAPVTKAPAARPAAAKKVSAKAVRPAMQVSQHIEEGCGTTGSITAPEHVPHEHEGKPLPCHPADSDRIPLSSEPVVAPAPKASPLFTGDDLVRSVVMSEILTRPRFENGRRVIR